jgi:hypothetical protein
MVEFERCNRMKQRGYLTACLIASIYSGFACDDSGNPDSSEETGVETGTQARDDAAVISDASVKDAAHETESAGGTQARRDAAVGHDAGIDLSSATARTEACIEYIRAWCERNIECGMGQTFPECMMRANTCPDQAFAEGSVRTVEGLLECAEQWRQADCNSLPGYSPRCALPGTRVGGEPCISNMQCASSLCIIRGMNCGVCDSSIRAHVGEGESCQAEGSICDYPTYCDSSTERCLPMAQQGEACDELNGPPCQSGVCGYDAASGTSYCVPYPTLGQECSVAAVCEWRDSYCDVSGVCMPYPEAGENCGRDTAGDARWCALDSACDVSVDPPVCRLLPTDGMPCDNNRCAEDSYCDFGVSPPICRLRKSLGEPCQGPCAGELVCTCGELGCTGERFCKRLRFPGESCTEPNDVCLPSATNCENGVCVAVEWQGLFETLCQ